MSKSGLWRTLVLLVGLSLFATVQAHAQNGLQRFEKECSGLGHHEVVHHADAVVEHLGLVDLVYPLVNARDVSRAAHVVEEMTVLLDDFVGHAQGRALEDPFALAGGESRRRVPARRRRPRRESPRGRARCRR